MSKFTFVFLVVAMAVTIQGIPLQPADQLAIAARSGNWDDIHRILHKDPDFQGLSDWSGLPDDVTSLRGGTDSQVFGKSVSVFKSSSNINGKKSEVSKGHAVINDNGKIQEYDFKP